MNGLYRHTRRKLALRQVLWVLALTMIMGLITSGIRASLDYLSEIDILEDHVHQLFAISEASAAQALYHLDAKLGERIANGLLSLPIIGRVRLVDDFGAVFVQKDNLHEVVFFRPLRSVIPQPPPFRHSLIFQPETDGSYNETVGYIEIEIDGYPIFTGLLRRTGTGLLMDLIQYLVIATLLSYIFYRSLARPLLRMTREIATIHPSRPEEKRISIPPGNEEDELGQLVHTINEILTRLQALNQELEKRVEERTATLNEEREQLLSIFDSIHEVIYVTDPATHRILFVNQAFKQLWGDATGKICHEVIHGTQTPCSHCNGLHTYGDQPHTHEFFNESTLNWFRCLSRGIRWPDGRMVRYEMAFDITVQKETETALRERSLELERMNRELQESIEALQNTREQLVQSEKMASLGSLVAGISHEINTPVGNSITAASFLGEKTRQIQKTFSSGELRQSDFTAYMSTAVEATDILETNLKRAADLITGFKQVAVDQTSNLQRRFLLRNHLEDTILSLTPRLRHTHHKTIIHCPEKLELYQNPGAISQIATNLILNSLTHAFDPEDRGEMHFDIQQSGDMVKMIYRDNGKGVSAQTLKHIFDPFYTTARGSGGTGLGMHIVYNLVSQTLRGSILCESPEEGGIRFVLLFPRIPEQPAAATATVR
ncbi:ATP-binding protein [Desulfobotulus sp. H1]|uniref:histidine kinase n=1 Tax=Desulfobotulus pelophilus TaxID=2823377 RepID=A0ABT3N8S7_9BACT|nr:ATP-binding protein [Desulfobotulus pelophilus]MCW7753601.1 ATP-binding protein [Desulfobotulus pelophilus]